MFFKRVAAPALMLWVASLGLAAAEEKFISGQVLDAAGKPVSGLDVSADWTWSKKDRKFTAGKSLKTDATGRFVGKLEVKSDPVLLMAFNKDRTVGGVAVLSAQAIAKTVKLPVGPLSTVTGQFDAEDFAETPKHIAVRVLLNGGKTELLSLDQPPGQKLELKLPAGEYQLVAECPGAKGAETSEFTLAAGQASEDLGTVNLEPGKASKVENVGRAVPELTFTDARGVPKDFKLSDYKGKWVMLKFWGYW